MSKMLEFVVLAIVATTCLSQNPGDYDYIACDDCRIPDGEFPAEGEMICFTIKKVYKMMMGRIWKCYPPVVCDNFFCVPQKEKCLWERGTISVPECQLERKTKHKPIDHRVEEIGTFYQINSPRYYGFNEYPNNTFCVWNVANHGIVNYHILDQQLQEPSDCDQPGCDCPDSVKITMGSNGIRLCGSDMPQMNNQISFNGLHVTFCSDNKHTSKGVRLMAVQLSESVSVDLKKREATAATAKQSHEATGSANGGEVDHVTCQYDYMMRASQPDVPCPNGTIIKSLLQYHNQLMSASNDGMCSGMGQMTTMMPMMNKLERCAAEHLYQTKDCKFAKMLLNSANGELRAVARAVVENDFVKSPRWMNITRRKCTSEDD